LDTFINLPYGGPGAGFRVSELVSYIRRTERDFIIQGQQKAILAKHTKPHSLDVWLRICHAANPDIMQAVDAVMDALAATGRFERDSSLPCPKTGHLVKGLRLVDPPT